MVASKLMGHYPYLGVRFNLAKLSHFYWVSTQPGFKRHHKPKRRMQENRKSGSQRSASLKLVFTS